MNTFLYVQWKKSTDKSRFVIDGSYSEHSSTPEQTEVMKMISRASENTITLQDKGNKELSPSFCCSHSKDYYFVEGNFLETDEYGRKLVFIFATKKIKTETDKNVGEMVCEKLKKYSKILEVTPHEADIEQIKNHSFKKKINKWTIIIPIAALALYILQNLLSEQ